MKQYTHNDVNPFLGCENNGIMLGRNGEYTIGYEMQLPPIFTIAEEIHDSFVEKFTQGIKILPKFCRVHRQDFVGEQNIDIAKLIKKQEGQNFFEEEYIRTFSTRPVLYQKSYLYFTLIPKTFHKTSICTNTSVKTRGAVNISKSEVNEFINQVEQFIAFLTSVKNQDEDGQPSYIKTNRLQAEDYLQAISSEQTGVLANHLFLGEHIYSDICYNERSHELRVGDKLVDIYSVSSLENVPAGICSCINYDLYNLPTGWGGFLAPVMRFPHIVNTYIIKGDPEEEKKSLEKRQNFLNSFASVARANERGAEDIEDFLTYTEDVKANIVDVHMNIIIWDKEERALAIKKQSVSTMFADLGCENIKAENYNKLNLFIASMPGNCINIFDEYRFKTLDCVAAIMPNFIGLQKTNLQEKGFRVLDRLSKSPVKINIDEPFTKGFNKNMFVLGGSGSGKSFAMNHYLNGELEEGTHAMIIDIGRSYEGLCSAYNGKWYEFSEDSPLSFNPFILSKFDWNATEKILNDEKAQALSGIIKVLWKGPDANFTQTESNLVYDLLRNYYKTDINERCFNTFYEYIAEYQFEEDIDFNKKDFLFNLRKTCYKTGSYPMLLNAKDNESLINEKLIIFEFDNIKKNKLLMSITTTVIMDVFVSKMRNLPGKKIIMFEEAWSALSNDEMSGYIQWLAKTARKFNAKLIVVTQELNDILNSKIGPALISNCSEKFLLDQSNFKADFDSIQKILGLSNFQKAQVLSINKGKEPGDKSRDFFIGFQYGKSTVAQVSVSRAEALLYSSSQEEKKGIEYVAEHYSLNYADAIKLIIRNMIKEIDAEQKTSKCDFYTAVTKIINRKCT